MIPLKKYITSKSVIILLIFLTSTSFGFLENKDRGYESRRSFRERRVSKDREFPEELPFRRETGRRANEKDKIYENLYDMRSFRTGTDRNIRNQDRNLEDRSTSSSRVNRISDRLIDNSYQQDRSRSYIQNNRIIRLDRTANDRRSRVDTTARNIRQHRDRISDDRKIRETSYRKNVERIPENRQSVLRLESFSREYPERIVDNRNKVSRINYRINQNQDTNRNLQEIPSRNIIHLQRRERSMENGENRLENRVPNSRNTDKRYRDYRVVDVRKQASRSSLSRSSRGIEEQSMRTSANREQNFENRERRFRYNTRNDHTRQNEQLARFRDDEEKRMKNRQCDLELQGSQANKDTRGTRGFKSSYFYQVSRERLPLTIQFRSTEQRLSNRSFRQYRNGNRNENKENRDHNSNNRFQENESNTKLSRKSRSENRREGNPSMERFSSVNRDDSTRTSRIVQNRYRNVNIQRTLTRDSTTFNRRLSNDVYRAVLSRRDSTRQMLDARINSQPVRNIEHAYRSLEREISTSNPHQRIVDRRLVTNSRHRMTNMRSLKSVVPIVEYVPNTGRSLERTTDVQQSEILVHNFKFDALVNVVQVILGVYLIGQIFAHSSKKKPFGYRSLLPSLNSIKDKLE